VFLKSVETLRPQLGEKNGPRDRRGGQAGGKEKGLDMEQLGVPPRKRAGHAHACVRRRRLYKKFPDLGRSEAAERRVSIP